MMCIALLLYPKLLFSCADFPGNTGQIARAEQGGGRVSRSVWSAWSLLPLSDVWRGSKAGASSTHSIRFAPFGSGSAGLRTDAPYLCSPIGGADKMRPPRRAANCQAAFRVVYHALLGREDIEFLDHDVRMSI